MLSIFVNSEDEKLLNYLAGITTLFQFVENYTKNYDFRRRMDKEGFKVELN
ncbi:hypothetical protein Mpet_2306 [Methanolacinia petrolearia DSM 11571]|uniref:Uncharacterized protein n=1 Tax=Methanolacinia petrolearia (strain DSM 11571 / OCM 486 / SEBR 4847) TaxID=679926 RepID=E1RD70_METP4|nr:hypothetical protein Mpet_2306 [Methanolacinia petrolearia DSM 11571]